MTTCLRILGSLRALQVSVENLIQELESDDGTMLPWDIEARRIMEQVAEETGVSIDTMRSRRRKKEHVRARHEAMLRLYQTDKFSYSQIGWMFNRHHTTVMAAVKRTENGLASS